MYIYIYIKGKSANIESKNLSLIVLIISSKIVRDSGQKSRDISYKKKKVTSAKEKYLLPRLIQNIHRILAMG